MFVKYPSYGTAGMNINPSGALALKATSTSYTMCIEEKPMFTTVKVTLNSFPLDAVVLRPESVKRSTLTTPMPSNLESGKQ